LTYKALTLQHLAHILDLDEDLEWDDHEHQLGLIDLEVQSVEEGKPKDNEGYQHNNQINDKDCDLSLCAELELCLN
jgi:hypothetical protein